MPEFPLLTDLLLLLSLSVAIVIAFHRLGLPPVIGFLLTGVVCGPHGLGFVSETHEVEVLAELGVVLLLFTVGIELSLEKLVRLRWFLVIGGGLQVGLTLGVSALLANLAGVAWPEAVFLGMLVSLSSTAIVIRIVADRGEIDTPYGRASVAVLIFQDLCIVPMVLLTPFLAGKGGGPAAIAWVALKALAFVAGAVLAARYLVPWIFQLAVRTRRREVFVLTVALLCLGAAWASAQVGLSLALGAFIAGLILSESEYGMQALGDVLPFREVFNSLFFISVGLLLDVRTVWSSPGWVLGSVAAVVVLKAVITGGATLVLGYPLRVAAATGLALAQIGEFSFVLSRSGIEAGLLGAGFEQLFLAAAVITMALTPGLHAAGLWVQGRSGRLAAWRLPLFRAEAAPTEVAEGVRDHVVVVGYGVNGRNLTRVLSSVEIPYVAIEMNPHTVREESAKGVPILYGDATAPETLGHAGIHRARALVVAISDAAATRRVVALGRRLSSTVHIVARTRYVEEVRPILALGAEEVIPEEFETSVEIFSRVLSKYLVPRDVVDRCVREVRKGAYEMLRADARADDVQGIQRFLSDVAFEVFQVAGGSPLAGKTLAESRIRTLTGATVVAVQRPSGAQMPNPAADEVFDEGELVVVLGSPEQLALAAPLFRALDRGDPAGDGGGFWPPTGE
ncbi:MAG: cation:proton antiporter domain-containing protein [Deferrisomatales bacterium]